MRFPNKQLDRRRVATETDMREELQVKIAQKGLEK